MFKLGPQYWNHEFTYVLDNAMKHTASKDC
jgi:hypothetical protein